MLETLCRLRESLDRSEPVAYCQLVETRGSTPQKAGAVMLVYPTGAQAGTLGGGCVEAEVKRQALTLLAAGTAKVVRFDLDNDYGWDDGLICGGRMQVLVEPVHGGAAAAYFRRLIELAEAGDGGTEVIAFDAAMSELPVPSSYLFDATGRLCGRHPADGSEVPAQVRRLLEVAPETITGDSGSGHGGHFRPASADVQPRGATRPLPRARQGIAFLPLLPRCRLLIVGGGHVGKAVAELAVDVDFDVWVVDDREPVVSADRFPRAQRRIAGPIEQVLSELEITRDTYCLIVTRGHRHDERALDLLADRGARYVGMIGSRRKIRLIFDDLLAEGVSPDALARVHAPVGIDIGSQTVAEIAVSIVAELVAHRNCGGMVPGQSGSTARRGPS